MEWTYNENTIDRIYGMWEQLGFRTVGGTHRTEQFDIEALIAETTQAARYDGRLLQVLMTWLRDYGDLINKRRLIRFLPGMDQGLFGAVLEIAIAHGGDPNYVTVVKKCKPHRPPEVLLKGLDEVQTYAEEQVKFGKPEYKKWGLFCTAIEFYEDAMRPRNWILQHNRILSIRAVFGPNIRSELLALLEKGAPMPIRKIALELGYAYSGVYREVMTMEKNGLLKEKPGKGRFLSLSERMDRILGVAENAFG